MLTMSKKPTKCLNHPKAKAKWRGVCLSCYFTAKRMIESGEATDAGLVASGFWDAPRKKGGKVRDLIRQKLAKSASK